MLYSIWKTKKMEMRREYIVTDVKHLVEANGKVNSFASSRRQWHLGKQDAKKVGWQTNAIPEE